MKLLFFSPNSEIGGAEAVLIEDLIALASSHEIHLILPDKGTVAEKLKDTNIALHYVPFDWWIVGTKFSLLLKIKFLRGFMVSAARIKALIQQIKPEAVITNTLASPVAALGAYWAGIKHVWYIHELGKEDHGLHFIYGEKTSYWLINKLSRQIINCSHFVQNKVKQFVAEKDKLHVLYCSMEMPAIQDFTPAHQANSQSLQLLITGRIGAGKRQEDAIKATEILAKQYGVSVHLTLVGDRGGEYSESLKQYVAANHLANHVTFVAFTDNIYEHYQKSDIVLVCSRCEAFGRVTIEAMKMKKTVIASNAGANPELIGKEERGFLYEVGNPSDLAKVIQSVYPQKKRLQQINEAAYQWAWNVCNKESHLSNLLNIIKNA